MNKIITIIKLFRIQASIGMNLFIFLPLLLYTNNFVFSFFSTLPFILMISGEIALNDCFDLEKDKISKPQRPLTTGNISRKLAFICAITVIVISHLLSIIAYYNNIKRLIIFTAVLLILTLYNLPWKYIALIKTFITAFCTVMCLLFSCTYINIDYSFIFFIIAAFLFILGRELLMDIRDIEGDNAQEYYTIATRLGIKLTTYISMTTFVFSCLLCGIYVILNYTIINIVLFIILVLVISFIFKLYNRSNIHQNTLIILLWIPMLIMLIIVLLSI